MTGPCHTDKTYTIRELADRFDVTARTLRFYEQKGLLSPERKGSTRIYSAEDRARLILILRGKRVGFSLEDIKEMFEVQSLDESSHEKLQRSLDKFRARISALEIQRQDIEDALGELQAGCAWLEERLANREPSDDIKHRARAFEQLAAARLDEWTGGHGQ